MTAVACTAQFVVVLDVTIVTTALPVVRDSLDFPAADLHWVITAYTLVLGGLLVPGGRVADVLGPRRAFLIGLGLFATASAACALAWSPLALVAARAVQGLGAALLSPAALALLTTANPPGPTQRRAIGWWTAAAATGGASGWLVGGLLTEYAGWRQVFWVNVPLVAAAVAVGVRTLPRDARRRRGSLNLVGALTATGGLGLLVYGLTILPDADSLSDPAPVALFGSGAALAFFGWHERRTSNPLVPGALLRSRPVVTANLTALSITAATSPAMLLATLYVQQVLGFPPTRAALLFPALNVAVVAGSLGGPGVLRRLGARGTLSLGFGGIGVGAALLLGLPSSAHPVPSALAAFTTMGIGLGCASVASTHTGTEAAPAAHRGVASGLLNASAQLGTAVGLAVVTPLAASAETASGYRLGWTGCLAIAALGLLAGLLAPGRQAATSRERRALRGQRTPKPSVSGTGSSSSTSTRSTRAPSGPSEHQRTTCSTASGGPTS